MHRYSFCVVDVSLVDIIRPIMYTLLRCKTLSVSCPLFWFLQTERGGILLLSLVIFVVSVHLSHTKIGIMARLGELRKKVPKSAMRLLLTGHIAQLP